MTVTPIVALDVPTQEAALTLVDQLGDQCRFYKVGSELFTAAGPQVVESIRGRGNDVFLDLKLHDIPNTVKSACRSAAAMGASLLTVHTSGGRAMLEAAMEGAGEGCGVLGVTVLTSLDSGVLSEAWGRSDAALDIVQEVLRLADIARAARLRGVVCSGQEAEAVRNRHGGALQLLIPGVRFADGAAHDQVRTVTPAAAARAGASYIILGRAVTRAPDPVAAMRRVNEELSH